MHMRLEHARYLAEEREHELRKSRKCRVAVNDINIRWRERSQRRHCASLVRFSFDRCPRIVGRGPCRRCGEQPPLWWLRECQRLKATTTPIASPLSPLMTRELPIRQRPLLGRRRRKTKTPLRQRPHRWSEQP